MEKKYLGLTDKGQWEEFFWDSEWQEEEPSPEATGYEQVKFAD